MRKLRVLAWIIIFGVIGIVLSILYESSLPERHIPVGLETKMSALDGSLYNSETSQFGIESFEFGNNFSKTVQDLGLDAWFSDEDIEIILGNMSDIAGKLNTSHGDDTPFKAFGGKEYTIGFGLSRSLNCYSLKFIACFIDPELARHPPLSLYNNLNHLTYDEMCQYFDDMMNAFLSAYGTPTDADLSKDLEGITVDDLQKGAQVSNYALWISEADEVTSVLRLSAESGLDVFSNDTQRVLTIRVYVGQTIPDVPREMLLEELNRN